MDDEYFKIYLDQDNMITIINLKGFEELELYPNRIYKKDDGTDFIFHNLESAVKFVNDTFKSVYISNEILNQVNLLFKGMRINEIE